LLLSFVRSLHHLYLLSFPTRRSSDLYPISALQNFNIDTVFNRILELLPDSPAFYPKDQITDKPERFFVNETIREKILMNYSKEIDRKSTRLNSSHVKNSYAVFCLKKQ